MSVREAHQEPNGVNAVMARKLGLMRAAPDDAAQPPKGPTSTQLMRRAFSRAADTSMGLSAAVLGIAEDDHDADALIDGGPDGWVVFGLRDGNNAGLTGLFLIDPALRSAFVEMQTMGHLLPTSDDQRAVTRTDAVLAHPFASQLLIELGAAGFGGDTLTPAGYDIGPIDDLRTAGLVLIQGAYRSWRITVQIGGGDRQGEVLIAMRPKVVAALKPKDTSAGWSGALRGALEEASADLDAVLTQMTLNIQKVEEFEVGQVLQLAGTTVGSVILMGPDGKKVAMARLGQVAGKRAVRIETEIIELQDAPPQMAAPPSAPPVRGIAAPPDIESPPKAVMAPDMAQLP